MPFNVTSWSPYFNHSWFRGGVGTFITLCDVCVIKLRIYYENSILDLKKIYSMKRPFDEYCASKNEKGCIFKKWQDSISNM